MADAIEWAHADEKLSPFGGTPVVLVDTSAGQPRQMLDPGSLPVVILGLVNAGEPMGAAAQCDVLVERSDPAMDAIVRSVERQPLAATALAVLLRGEEGRTVEEGLAAESAVYSTLQAGPGFLAWLRAAQLRPPEAEPEPPVLAARDGVELTITLNRPARHNAFSASMRDGLVEALSLALVDSSIETVRLRGTGPSFCSGGDLGEFGSFPDPATAHAVRLTRSPARLAHRLRDRLQVHLHGACLGAGIELPAFAGHVVAAPDTSIGLPELELGLIPGAGGTTSLPRRIGRQRTMYLALSGSRIGATTALEWGLVDEVSG